MTKYSFNTTQDVALLDKLDKKLRFIDLSNETCLQTLFCYRPMGAVAVTEQAIVNEAHRRGMRVPTDSNVIPNPTAPAGAMWHFPRRVCINGLVPRT